ncbi:MAG: outer membrane protein transport protein [Gammaproteobacteria bacterium]|nr:outer membrane protein transport protein [Gammaproteobacteria bacterium]
MATTHPFARRLNATCIAGLLSLTSGSALAAGFALIEQSVSSMGTAYAGAGSAAEDASYIYFNPASMSRLEGTQVSGGLHVVLPKTEFSGDASYNPTYLGSPPPPSGPPILAGADNNTDAGVTGAVPHFAYVRELNDKMNFGLTINVPFGLKTEYGNGWVGRYSSTEGEVKTVNLNPTLSFKVDEHVTVGVGLSVMYANLIYQNIIDGDFPSDTSGTTTNDIPSKIDVDDWGFGWNFGALLQPTDSTRLGIAYRSKIEVELEGDISAAPAVTGSAKADANLPDSILLSAFHQVNPQWAVMADVMWTQWSRIDKLAFRLGNGTTSTIPLKWEDSFRYAIGTSYKKDDRWTLRGGLAFDESPTPSPEFRISALPDEDRTWLTIGAGFKYSKNISLDFGYAHLFIDDTDINSTDAYSSLAAPLVEGPHLIDGEYEASVDIISAQVNWKFD